MLKSFINRINRLAASTVTAWTPPLVIYEFPDGHIEHRESGRSWPTLADAETALELPPATGFMPRLIHVTFVASAEAE